MYSATIRLTKIEAHSGYFWITFAVKNTGTVSLQGLSLRPWQIVLPDNYVISDPPFKDPMCLASWLLPNIAMGETALVTLNVPVNSVVYQSENDHFLRFYVIQEGVAFVSNMLTVAIQPVSIARLADPFGAALHNMVENLVFYQSNFTSQTYSSLDTGTLDSNNLTATGTLSITSSDARDTQVFRIVGANGSGDTISEKGILSGTRSLSTTQVYSKIYDFVLLKPANGTVSVNQLGNNYISLPAGYCRPPGLRFADDRPRLITCITIGCQSNLQIKLTGQDFGVNTPEYLLFENWFEGGDGQQLFYSPMNIPAKTIVRIYARAVNTGTNVSGSISVYPIKM